MRRLALLLLLLPGCFLTRHETGPALPDDLSAFVVGTSTKADALALLGPPHVVRRQFDGDLYLWINRRSHSEGYLLIPFIPVYSSTEGESRDDIIALLFDHRGRLAGLGRQDGLEL